MLLRNHRNAGLLAIFLCGCTLGCSGRSDRPATVPVSGTVTYQGKPVEGASVGFLAPGAPGPAYGTTDAAGHFRLTTFVADDGAIVGRHVVTVSKYAPGATPQGPVLPGGTEGNPDPAAIDAAMQQTARDVEKAKRSGSILPEKYSSRNTSDLTVDIVDGENVVELELKD